MLAIEKLGNVKPYHFKKFMPEVLTSVKRPSVIAEARIKAYILLKKD